MSTSVVEAFCCQNPSLKALLHVLCLPFVLELVRLGIKMERMIARDSHLQGACRWLVEIAAETIDIAGTEGIPRSGPLLLVGNHAGLGDAHAALLALPRQDTLLLARDFGILPGLAQFRQYVIVVDEARPHAAIRRSIQHLRSGGSLLLFPRGEIEADPALDLEAALASLSKWTRSIDLFARHVPDLTIVPLAVAGLLSRRALRNPLVRCNIDRKTSATSWRQPSKCYSHITAMQRSACAMGRPCAQPKPVASRRCIRWSRCCGRHMRLAPPR